ncbi:MAG TPA: InlB B-repeat-containing protein [Candidatus Limadaptatus stercoripullorum]|uniref:InlB B-repeat-containing protein n=1 Tax=Candidatus Limadaptatus stercoripullorum TaxID=2840846 RepID=A0A9D1N8L3_9FIRM|nr:InlB B-repeat-containing protein [Candidatus Limadaptatus stercoripullorum]
MKKKATRILLAVLLLALAASLLAACDPDPQEGGSGGGTVSTTYYTVSFDTAGGSTSFGSYTVRNVPRGSTVAQPKRADGSVAVPTRKGYTFDHWSYNGSEFVFSDTATDDSPATPVTEDITLTAVWTANKYTLRLHPSDPELPYDGGLTIAGVEGAFAEPVDKPIDYDTAADDNNALLNTVTTDKEGDYFVYWYFYDAGERKEFTVWAKEGDKTVEMAARYETAGDTELYPMFHSLLPDITVTVDAAGGTDSPGTLTVKLGDTVSESALPDPVRDGYRFLGWSMTVDTNEDAEAQDFVLASEEEDADNSDATVVKENITLTAKWVKTVDISSADDLEAVRMALNGDDEKLKAEYASAEFTFSAPVEANDWTPLFDESLPFTGSVEGNGFSVTISGAADENGLFGLFGMLSGSVNDLVVRATLNTAPTAKTAFIGGIAAIAKDAEINGCAAHITIAENIAFPGTVYIGAAAGASKGGLTISGIHLDEGSAAPDTTYRTDAKAMTAGASAYIGGITGGSYNTIMNGGSVSSALAVVSAAINAAGDVYAGGLIGNSQGFTVTECYADTNLTVTGSTVYVGGLAGRSNTGLFSRSSCVGGSVAAKITATGSVVYAGGLVGHNGAAIDNCRADIAISASATSELLAGGVAGITDNHDIDSCYITGSITATGSGKSSAVYAAGVFGKALHDASFSRIYTETNITVTAEGGATADFLIAHRSSFRTIEFEKVFRFANMTVTVNGNAVEADEEEPEGVSVLTEDKRVNGWATGSDYLALDKGYWKYADGETGAHPSLKPFWEKNEETPEEGEEGSGESGEEGSGEEGSGESGETA